MCCIVKERAYSVGCKPPIVCAQLRLHAGYGSGRPPKGPSKTTTESKQRHQDSPGGTRVRKISVTSRPEHFHQKLSTETGLSGSSKSLVMVESRSAASDQVEKSTSLVVEGSIRPRTLTMPWDLLRGVRSTTDDLLRPRSSSGGNAASIREAVQARLAAIGRHPTTSSVAGTTTSQPGTSCVEPRGELVLGPPGDGGQEVGEYVEMRCPAAS